MLMSKFFYIVLFVLLGHMLFAQNGHPEVLILGVAQDGGYPHTGCEKKCCAPAWDNPALRRYVVSIALIDPASKKWWLFEATPDIREQLHYFHNLTGGAYNYLPDGIFVTHAHIGHYTGLMQLGREVLNTKKVPVYVLPKMKEFLETNGPWSQLVKLENISLIALLADSIVHLDENITIKAFIVPHRDEYSETAGYSISTTANKYLFIPDINKWEKWDRSILDEVKKADIALVDATCYDDGELPGRNMKEIQHPNVVETMKLFDKCDAKSRSKIYFIHTNHTNPLLWDEGKRKEVEKIGYHIAAQGQHL